MVAHRTAKSTLSRAGTSAKVSAQAGRGRAQRGRKPAARASRAAAMAEPVSYMNQMAGAVQRSGLSVARTMEDRPMALLAGVGLVGLLLALFFGRSR
jgi:hypothetical protein